MTQTRLATIGYQGASLDGLIGALREAGIGLLVDVRAVPWSRRPEFTGKALAQTLQAAGIGYRHLPALGNPEKGREAARDGRSYREIYLAHLDTVPDAVGDLADLAAGPQAVAVLCMERDPAFCHRSLLAGRLAAERGFEIVHLTVPKPGADRQPDLFS